MHNDTLLPVYLYLYTVCIFVELLTLININTYVYHLIIVRQRMPKLSIPCSLFWTNVGIKRQSPTSPPAQTTYGPPGSPSGWFHQRRGHLGHSLRRFLGPVQDSLSKRMTSWWFQPIWKILVNLDHFPGRGENTKYVKPPPRMILRLFQPWNSMYPSALHVRKDESSLPSDESHTPHGKEWKLAMDVRASITEIPWTSIEIQYSKTHVFLKSLNTYHAHSHPNTARAISLSRCCSPSQHGTKIYLNKFKQIWNHRRPHGTPP